MKTRWGGKLNCKSVVSSRRGDGLDAPYAPHVFLPARQIAFNSINVYARTASDPEALGDPIRLAVQAVNPDLPVFGVRSVHSVISESLASRRFAMLVLGFFAATALLLA